MFCPKCGAENPDNGIYCRKCGTGLGGVSDALERIVPAGREYRDLAETAELSSSGIRNLILGAGFSIVAFVVFSIPGDTSFWLFFSIPAFWLIASGLSRIVKYKQLVGKKANGDSGQISVNENVDRRADLPPARTEFVGKKNEIIKQVILKPNHRVS